MNVRYAVDRHRHSISDRTTNSLPSNSLSITTASQLRRADAALLDAESSMDNWAILRPKASEVSCCRENSLQPAS
jgi:hypothetical protein